ncbi:hypothetical protein B0H13DRAFT_1905657 [Mycena leptocephala]|nr:hypothetical protein B0H13DRAFT_1905657 [Mycena leptocephala]
MVVRMQRCATAVGNRSGRARGPSSAKPVDHQAFEVWQWRHKLQKTLLTNESLPDEQASEPHALTVVRPLRSAKSCLASTCYMLEPHKVPCDGKCKFRDRANALVEKWKHILIAIQRWLGSSNLFSPQATTLGKEKVVKICEGRIPLLALQSKKIVRRCRL